MASELRSAAHQATPHDRSQPPGTETERAVVRIWAEVLQLESVGVTDNFFDLGGHSILVHMVHDRIVRALGQDPPIVELFQYPTVRSLARYLDGRAAEDAAEDSGQPRHDERTGGRSRLERQRLRRRDTR